MNEDEEKAHRKHEGEHPRQDEQKHEKSEEHHHPTHERSSQEHHESKAHESQEHAKHEGEEHEVHESHEHAKHEEREPEKHAHAKHDESGQKSHAEHAQKYEHAADKPQAQKKKELVLPGDKIAIAEEYVAGQGTYEDNGDIYSSIAGTLDLDARDKIARVDSFNPLANLMVGDIVYGTVTDIRTPIATVEVERVKGIDRDISGENEASLHISKISSAYTSDIRTEMRIGDIVRGEVIQTKPSIQLTTVDRRLGVLKAMCARCRGPLVKKGRELYCESCQRSETRKMAEDYGDLKL